MELFAESLTKLDKTLPSDVQRYFVNRGYRGTKETIQKMREAVQWGKRWPGARRHVSDLISSCSRKDYMCMVRAVFDETQGYHYVFDPSGVELIQGIDETYRIRMGDCDDFSVKMCTELESIGIGCYFKCIKARPGSDEFTHVYVVAVVPGVGQVPLDATMPYPAGWEAANGKLPCKLWPSSFDEMETHGGGENSSMSGLATYPPELSQYGLSAPYETVATFTNCNLGALPIVSEDDDVSSLAGLDCAECGDTCGHVTESGLNGLGDGFSALGDNPQGDATIASVIDGSAYSELRAAKDESNQNQIAAGELLTAARKVTDPQERQKAMAMYEHLQASVTAERQRLQQTINAYSQLANLVQTGSMGLYKPQQLSGLGVAPLVVAAIVLAVGAASIYAIASGYAIAMAAWRGQADTSKGLIAQMTDFLNALGHAPKEGADALASVAKTVGIVAVVGLLAFAGYKLLKKREAV